MQVACRYGAGLEIRSLDADVVVGGVLATPQADTRVSRFSKDGSLFAWANIDAVFVVRAETGEGLHQLALNRAADLYFSPCNSFLATWQRPEHGTKGENLAVWDLRSGQRVAAFAQRSQTHWWPQWSDDEAVCVRLNTNAVHVYDGRDFGAGIKATLQLERVADVELAPGPAPHKMAVFVPEKNGAPANVRIYLTGALAAPTSMRTFFKADRVQLSWNCTGNRVLVLTQTEVDTTGQSYFGETNLYFLDAQGKYDCRITLDKEGPVHDITWSPTGREFVVVYGFMPAKAKLFDNTAKELHDFGIASRNMALFNPQGNLLCLAGFGNLSGDMEIWSREPLQKVCTIAGRDTTHMEWCPDGRHILGATLSPRLRVDNGFRIWHYRGALVSKRDYKELLQATMRPASFPARPLSPAPSGGVSAATNGATPALVEAKKASVYVPPHLRGQVGAGGGPRALYELAGENVGQKPAAPADKGAASAAKKAAAAPPQNAAEVEKKLKNANKKLKAIEELKALQAQGKQLEKNQLEKIEGEDALRKEVAALAHQLASAR